MTRHDPRNPRLVFFPLCLLLVAACSGQPSPQIVQGRAALASFPGGVTKARALRGGKVAVEAAVTADGSFSLTIPAGTGYRIDFVGAAAKPGLVFPRQAGRLEVSFDIRDGVTPFDLGMVRYIGDPAGHRYAYVAAKAETGDGECENGVDAATGAVCVDDNQNGDSCGDQGDHNCEDGIDPATGAECDGGPAANGDGGDQSEGDGGDTSDETAPGEAAVAEHNLPAAIGCEQEGA